MSTAKKEIEIMLTKIHQTHHQIADFEGIFAYLKSNFTKDTKGLHVFVENFLTGYPLQDLCLQKSFVHKYQNYLKQIQQWAKANIDGSKCCLLLGGLKYELSENDIPVNIYNVVYQIGSGTDFESVYTKRLLPNYDIFDEKKYYTKGNEAKVLNIFEKNIGILICEDMWASSAYDVDPIKEMKKHIKKSKVKLDMVVNLSASPYFTGKHEKRLNRAKYISELFQCPFLYSNRVGGEDEILFDGRSFIIDGQKLLKEGKLFESDLLEFSLHDHISSDYKKQAKQPKNLTWEDLFDSRINFKDTVAHLEKLNDNECQEIIAALGFGLQEYASKCGFNKFTIALSGGMDSALVLTIIRLSLKEGQSLEAIYMPSIHSSSLSYDLSLELCQKLGVPMKTLPIKFLHSTAKNLFGQTFNEPFEGLTDENIQSRLRGLLIYTRSNQTNSMVVNTSNKSELAVGYSTQYGDSVGAISMLGDLYKSQVYTLATFINRHYKNLIPEQIITRPATAELREGQVDTDSLPEYDILDTILEGVLNYRYSKKDLLESGFSLEDIEKTLNLYRRSEYKRYQFCPIIKVSSKSFGFGYRIPLSKDTKFYNFTENKGKAGKR